MNMADKDRMQLLSHYPEDEVAEILAALQDAQRKQVMRELSRVNAHTAECIFDTMRCVLATSANALLEATDKKRALHCGEPGSPRKMMLPAMLRATTVV